MGLISGDEHGISEDWRLAVICSKEHITPLKVKKNKKHQRKWRLFWSCCVLCETICVYVFLCVCLLLVCAVFLWSNDVELPMRCLGGHYCWHLDCLKKKNEKKILTAEAASVILSPKCNNTPTLPLLMPGCCDSLCRRIYCEDKHSFSQDCEDDGETAAGGRLLHLLQVIISLRKYWPRPQCTTLSAAY